MFLLTISSFAQFYAPETEFHDRVQRFFPVEAARVLAWRANQSGAKIAEISYAVTTDTNGATSWQLSWLDSNSRVLKTAKVDYASSALLAGPGYYRDVVRQLWSTGWETPVPTTMEAATIAFWKGADMAGVSREESLGRALDLVSAGLLQKDGGAPQLAGLLIHSALEQYGGKVTLDSLMEARGAAWLALTELSCSNDLTQLWAPVLFLAGREHAAGAAWGRGGGSRGASPENNEPVAAWDLWLKDPTTKKAFLFALDSTNRAFAMPILAFDVGVNGSGSLLAEMVERWTSSSFPLTALHNYAPLFASSTSVGGARILEGAWAAYQRRAWVDLLVHHQELERDGLDSSSVSKFVLALSTATNGLHRLDESDSGTLDGSLAGFTDVAPLLELGHKEGVGNLIPVPVVTARDLLNYGWEMTGLEMGARYCFVEHCWGVPERAKPILETVTGQVGGLQPFFRNAKDAGLYNYQECLYRLQHTVGFSTRVGWSPGPYCQDGSVSNACAELFMKRCWLRPDLFDWQARCLWDEGRFDGIAKLVDAAQNEEGVAGAAAALAYLSSISPNYLSPLPKAGDWMAKLAEQLPQPSKLYVNAIWQKEFEHKPFLERAKQLERLYWRNPDSQMEEWVFLQYAKAGAFGAARRFYIESRENLLDRVLTSNGLGLDAYIVGYLKGDAELRQMALQDSRSGSYSDMVLHMWDAAIQDDRKQLRSEVDNLIERYEKESGPNAMGARLKSFIPLLPALAEPKNPKHKEAIGYFGPDKNAVLIRWIWIEKFKLSKEDAIAFLGGRETDAARRVMVGYLEGDVGQTQMVADALMRRHDAQDSHCILAKFLSMKLDAGAREPEVPDLKPGGVSSARALVLGRLGQNSSVFPLWHLW